jgi:hypothetical protein
MDIRSEEVVAEVKEVLENQVEAVETAVNGKSWSCSCFGWTYTSTLTKNVVPPAK